MKRILQILTGLLVWFTGLTLSLVLLYKWVPVRVTPLMGIRMAEQAAGGEEIRLRHRWVSLRRIGPELQLAVICAEDQRFTEHHGFDVESIRKAVREAEQGKRRLRGASTLTQQTAKNLFLWPGRNWVRKGLETWFTLWLELLWSKKRILEVYLNIVEMGDGIYGAEAAAQHYFKVPAARLTSRQAAALAAILPNPRSYNAASPGPYVAGRIRWIQGQMRQYGPLKLH